MKSEINLQFALVDTLMIWKVCFFCLDHHTLFKLKGKSENISKLGTYGNLADGGKRGGFDLLEINVNIIKCSKCISLNTYLFVFLW